MRDMAMDMDKEQDLLKRIQAGMRVLAKSEAYSKFHYKSLRQSSLHDCGQTGEEVE